MHACGLQVVGWALEPFTVDKQTLMLYSLWRALRDELVPFGAINVSSWSSADVDAGSVNK